MSIQALHERIVNCEAEFIHFIATRLGIMIRHQNADLRRSIVNACHKFHCSPKEYLDRLVHCSDHSPLLEHLVTDITVGETYFFRDKQQMQWLKNILLPRLIKKKREQQVWSLRIWSAGASTGEEIYTIALLLKELLPDIHRWSIHLLGTDINTEALAKAKRGIYSKWSMRSISNYYKYRYFSEENNQFHLSSEIKEMVNFQYLNLNDNTYPSMLNGTQAQDVILCRNVLIYFTKETIGRLMKKISNSLVEGGFLLLGASDPVLIAGASLIAHPEEGMVFSRHQFVDSTTPERSLMPKKAVEKLKSLLSVAEIVSLLDSACWQQVLDVIQTKDTSRIARDFLLYAQSQALANLGQLNEAVQCCEESLLLNATDKKYYFIYALILIELNRLEEAEKALQKALFLDHTFIDGHFQLGLLLIRNKKKALGVKSLHNALTLVKSKDSSSRVEGFTKLDYGRFSEILQSEIELLAGGERHE